MNYIIFDLEATCEENSKDFNNETIEIGAVLINEKCEIKDEFCKFVKPLKNPILSEFCKKLTSIQQSHINQAQSFDMVIQEFWQWIQKENDEYILCSWGHYDKKQFFKDCQAYNLDTKWLDKHISLKHQYKKISPYKRLLGVKLALANENIQFTGTHHRGIDDARNIAKIFIKHFNKWNLNKCK